MEGLFVAVVVLAQSVAPSGLTIPYAVIGAGVTIAMALIALAFRMGTTAAQLASASASLQEALKEVKEELKTDRAEAKERGEQLTGLIKSIDDRLQQLERWRERHAATHPDKTREAA